jgi:hypothetical protein
MTEQSPSIACADGDHRPHRIEDDESGVQRAVCRACGCALMRNLATRRWYYSGVLGDSPAQAGLAQAVAGRAHARPHHGL